MLSAFSGWSMSSQLDKFVLYTMNRQMPDTFVGSPEAAPTFEQVLAETAVDTSRTVPYMLTAPGVHPVWLETADGPLRCQVRVLPAADPQAPLIIYHHGLNEYPYDNSWRRIFLHGEPFPAHTVCIQAPFHDRWSRPLQEGFTSLRSVYQMFAGSLAMMRLVQQQFTRQGAAFTMLAGVSWGGITSMLYGGLFRSVRALAPMFSSPNLAEVIWDVAQMFGREVPLDKAALAERLDFTPYYERCDAARVFPLMGELDEFFRLEKHGRFYNPEQIATITASHITGMWQPGAIKAHVWQSLERAALLEEVVGETAVGR